MNILVLIKEVPNMDRVKFDSERGVVDRTSAESEINPFDMHALQAANDIKKQCGGKIIVISMGPPKAESSLREAYGRGADECILLTDVKFSGADTFSTSKALAGAIKYIGKYDIVLCGEKSVDGDTAQVGAEVAEILNINHAYYVEDIFDIQNNSLKVSIEDLCGVKLVKELEFPILLSVTKNINTPKLPTLKRVIESIDCDVKKLGLKDMTGFIDENEVGMKGSPTKVSKIEVPKSKERKSQIYRDNPIEFISKVKEAVRRV